MNDLVLVQGMHDTKLALSRWNENPFAVLRPWAVLSTLISVGLLMAVYLVATLTPPDTTIYEIPGVTRDSTVTDYGHVLFRNSLVLARDYQIHSIAFPAISCGVYGYPVDAAATIAVREVRAFLDAYDLPERVVLVAFDERMCDVLTAKLEQHAERPT